MRVFRGEQHAVGVASHPNPAGPGSPSGSAGLAQRSSRQPRAAKLPPLFPRRATIASTVLLAAIGALTPASAGQRPRYGGELSRVVFASIASVDPLEARTFEELEVVRNVHARLLERTAEGIRPGLAAGARREDDRLVLRLRPGLVFHDGSPLNAAAARRSLVRLLRERPQLARLPGIPEPSGIRARGTLGLEFVSSPGGFGLLEELLASPEASIVRIRPEAVIGAGPFQIVERRPDQVRLAAFESHYDGRPYLDRVVIRSITAPATQRRALASGSWDVIDLPSVLEPPDGARVLTSRGQDVVVLRINSSRSPFESPRLIQALAAVDRTAMVDLILKGQGAPARHLVSAELFPPIEGLVPAPPTAIPAIHR